MKSIVIFYDDNNSSYKNEKVFNGKSAIDLTKDWAEKININTVETISSKNNVSELLKEMNNLCQKHKADYVIYSYNDLPFLNKELTKRMINSHEEFRSEYTFADGYSLGFSPEIIHSGTINILSNLAENLQKEAGLKEVTRNSIFDLIKTDINSFEIETIIADYDWRLLRLNFDCHNKDAFLSCKALYEELSNNKLSCCESDINQINKLAEKSPAVLKTVPGFYNIQITDFANENCIYCPYAKEYELKNKTGCSKAVKVMEKEKFSDLVKNISDFSQQAVIGLSLWGEAFSHPELLDFIKTILAYKGLSVFIETEGWNITDEFCNGLKQIVDNCDKRTNGWAPVMIAVQMDAVTEETYKKLHGNSKSLSDCLTMVNKLERAVPGNVYPQFMRMNINEPELEGFFRYWKEKENPSAGQFIIQKYDDYAGLLPDEKSADLSPIDRNVCWHLRRDMNILTNGDVILCKEYVLDNVIGNVFEKSLSEIWEKMDCVLKEHIEQEYKNKCGKCDESYTYNF